MLTLTLCGGLMYDLQRSQVGSDGTRSGWLSDNGAALSSAAEGIEVDWHIGDCSPGDVVILGESVTPVFAHVSVRRVHHEISRKHSVSCHCALLS